MTFFWLLFSVCVLSAWLIGYGMGYLGGARDAADIRNGDADFSGDWTSRENGSADAAPDAPIAHAEPARRR